MKTVQWRRQLWGIWGTCPPRRPTISFLVYFEVNLTANYPSIV